MSLAEQMELFGILSADCLANFGSRSAFRLAASKTFLSVDHQPTLLKVCRLKLLPSKQVFEAYHFAGQ